MRTYENMKVFARCRPLKPNETGRSVFVDDKEKQIKVKTSQEDVKIFKLDEVFPEEARQIDIYMVVVHPLVDEVLRGSNCSILAYGPTGTGKTFTIEGEKLENITSWEADSLCGIIPRAVSQIFETLEEEGYQFSIKVSFLELYNEDAYDLLSPLEDTTKLKIYDDRLKQGSVQVAGLRQVEINSKDEIYSIIRQGSIKRQTAATQLNACSSRSHTVFQIQVQMETKEKGSQTAKIDLVDLAGSENIGRSGAQGKHAREAGHINQSLLTLGRVIQALVDKSQYIPYRGSNLTRILQDSLSASTRTSIIATISPATIDVENTLNALEYASRAKRVVFKTPSNVSLSNNSLLTDHSHIEELIQARLSEREYEIRNEVSKEFRKESDNIKKYFEEKFHKDIEEADLRLTKLCNKFSGEKDQLVKEKQELITQRDELIAQKEQLNSQVDQFMVEKGQLIGERDQLLEDLNKTKLYASELEEKLTKTEGNLMKESDNLKEENDRLKNQVHDLKGENSKLLDELDKIKTKLERMNQKMIQKEVELGRERENNDEKLQLIEQLEQDMKALQHIVEQRDEMMKLLESQQNQQLKCSPIVTPKLGTERKANRIKKNLADETSNYANLSIDNDDELIQASTKKTLKRTPPGIRKRAINQAIMVSGKKRKLESQNEELIDVSPEKNKRVTRSRATKKKLFD